MRFLNLLSQIKETASLQLNNLKIEVIEYDKDDEIEHGMNFFILTHNKVVLTLLGCFKKFETSEFHEILRIICIGHHCKYI